MTRTPFFRGTRRSAKRAYEVRQVAKGRDGQRDGQTDRQTDRHTSPSPTHPAPPQPALAGPDAARVSPAPAAAAALTLTFGRGEEGGSRRKSEARVAWVERHALSLPLPGLMG